MADLSIARGLGIARGAAIRHLDLITVGAALGLVLMGLLSVYSATITVDPDAGNLLSAPSELFNRQLFFALLAGVVFLAVVIVDYRHFKIYAAILYVACLILLILVLTPLAESVRGSHRWISLGIFNLQPSELAKPVLVCALAAYLSERRGQLTLQDVVRTLGIAAPYAMLVFLQPDFGTMLVLGSITAILLVVAGADWRHLALLLATAAVGIGVLFNLGFVHEYQRARLMAFLDPARDPERAGYNYRLTKQAVGNGGLFGQGLLRRDSLTNLDFVPEQHNDFVFTVVAEQMGFFGGATLIGLYGVVFARGLRGASQSRDMFGTYVVAGLVGYLTFQVFVNIGMTLGLVPITGVPLPFVSYGGSALMSSAIAVGLVVSVRMRRFSQPL